MWTVKIDNALGINFFFIPQFAVIHNWAYLCLFDNTIAHWSMPVRQFLLNLQTLGAFIAAFTSEKRYLTIKKSLFRHWPLMLNFSIAYRILRCKTKGAVRAVCVLLRI